MAYMKDIINQTREMGFEIFPGMEIPDKNNKEFWNVNNFKLANEIIMQVLLDKKIKKEKIKREFHQNFIDLTLASEVFGRIEKDRNGKIKYRVINPKYAIYEDSVYDPLLERTPFMGEKRMMYYHEIVNSDEFDLGKEELRQLKELGTSGSEKESSGLQKIGSELAYPVYMLEWKGFETVKRKISYVKGSKVPYKTILSPEYWEKNQKQILKDVERGKYEVETAYREIVWSASRIGQNIFTSAKKEEDVIQILNDNNVYTAEYNYCGYLFGTTDGERVGIQELIIELEKVYDDIRFQINKELKKFKGSVIWHDEAFRPKGKRFIDIIHDIDEHGIIRYNSSAEGNEGGRDLDRDIMKSVQLGSGEPLRILVEQAIQIEHTIDKITGLNDNRQGLTKATTTATANVNNIEASRSITYDLFYCMTDYMEKVLMKIIEKEKLCLKPDNFVLDESEMRYLTVTRDTLFANYYPYLSDGRIEQSIRERLEMMFSAEINAGNLRSSDVAKFLRESSFAKALKILEDANKELAEIRKEEIAAQQEGQQASTQAGLQIAQEDREDRQEHEKEIELLRNEAKKEQIMLSESLKGMSKESVTE